MGVLPLGESANVERFEFAPREGRGRGDFRGNRVCTMDGWERAQAVLFFFFFSWGIKCPGLFPLI